MEEVENVTSEGNILILRSDYRKIILLLEKLCSLQKAIFQIAKDFVPIKTITANDYLIDLKYHYLGLDFNIEECDLINLLTLAVKDSYLNLERAIVNISEDYMKEDSKNYSNFKKADDNLIDSLIENAELQFNSFMEIIDNYGENKSE